METTVIVEPTIDITTVEIKSVIMKFSDAETINMEYNDDTKLLSLIKKAIVSKNKQLNDINEDYIPEKYLNRFKIVYKGMIIKVTNDFKVIDINNLVANCILHCVFPPLTENEINEIKAVGSVPIEIIDRLLNSVELIELLKKPEHFNFLKSYIESAGKINTNISTNVIDINDIDDKSKTKKQPKKAVKKRSPISSDDELESEETNIDSQYSLQIEEIVNMGFECNDRIKILLRNHNGDVQNVLNILLG